jgi:hypothetical protein
MKGLVAYNDTRPFRFTAELKVDGGENVGHTCVCIYIFISKGVGAGRVRTDPARARLRFRA